MKPTKANPLKYIQLCLLEHKVAGGRITSRLEPNGDAPEFIVLEAEFKDGHVEEWGIDVELLSSKRPQPKVIDRTFGGLGDGPNIPSGPVAWFAWDRRRPREETEIKVVSKTAFDARSQASMKIPETDPICIEVIQAK